MQVMVQSSVSGSPPARHVRAFLRRAAKLTRAARRRAVSQSEVSVFFCGDRRMRRLNQRFRRKDRTTDVLAFPAGNGLLGDIVVSVPYAARQAGRRGEAPGREIDRLLLHGFLHLLGYDHETDHGEMDALEARLRSRLGVSENA